MIMPANNMSGVVHYFAGRYPGKIGLLISPNGWRPTPWYLPYALDNGAFYGFDGEAFIKMLLRCRTQHKPLFVLVPDVIEDPEATLEKWHTWKQKVASFNWPLAFAAQDGMLPQDIPQDAFCCFVGGSLEWKEENAHRFKGICKWLHIGRVNGERKYKWAESIGADSIDGTGWFRGGNNQNNVQLNFLIEYLEGSPQMSLFKRSTSGTLSGPEGEGAGGDLNPRWRGDEGIR